MKASKKKQKQNISVWFLFAASSAVIIFFLWYFLIYVSGNEKLLIQKSFRVLNQIGENFKGREKSFRGLTESPDMKEKLNATPPDGELSPFDRAKFLENNPSNKKLGQVNSRIKAYYSNLEIDEDSLDKDYYYFSKDYKNNTDSLRLGEFIFVEKSKKVQFVLDKTLNIYFKINKKDFFEPIERKDVFDDIIIIKNIPSKISNNKYEFIYSSFSGDIDSKNLDSLTSTGEGLSSGIVKHVELSGIEYVIFISKIQLLNNESYYIGGIINNEIYGRQIRAINTYIALLLIFLFFIFLFSIPLIKLKMISEKAQLKISDLLLSISAIIFGAFFTLLVTVSLFSHFQRVEDANKYLIQLSNSVRDTLTNEIENIHSSLTEYKEFAREKNKENEQKEFSPNRYSRLSLLPYNYYKLIFDLDNTGQQKTVTSSRTKPPTWDNYSFRRYFKESGEWEFDSLKLMLDYIVSNTSGEKLGVVSKRDDDFVYVITSRLYSVINTILPPGYGFCLIDKEGAVKFHSNSAKMLQENFIEESENSNDLKQAIYGNLSTHFSAKYIGKNHLCYIQQFSTLPLYLITFYDSSYSNSVKIQVVSLTFIFSLFVLAMFILIVFISRSFIPKDSALKRRLDIVDWLRPDKYKVAQFKKIYLYNFAAIFFMILSSILAYPEQAIFLIFIIIITQFLTTFFYQNYLELKRLKIIYLLGFLLPTFAVLSFLMYVIIKSNTDFSLIIVINLILIISNYIIIKLPINIFTKFKVHTHSYLHFFCWLSLVIIVPLFIFFITFYNYESKTSTSYNLYSYANEIANRNYSIDKFYKDNIDPSYYKFKEERKKKGIYYLEGLNGSTNSELFKKNNHETNTGALDRILFYLKPDIDTHSRDRKSLIKNLPNYDNKNIEFSDSSVALKFIADQVHRSSTNLTNVAYYEGEINKFGFSKTEWWISFVVAVLIALFLIWILVKFLSDKVFGSSVERSLIKGKFSDVLSDYINSNSNLIIQYSNYQEYKSFPNIESKLLDYCKIKSNSAKQLEKHWKSIIINNIRIDLDNPKAECEKFLVINQIAERNYTQLILVSDFSFAKLIEENESRIEIEKDNEHDTTDLKCLQKILNSINKKFIHLFPPLCAGDDDNENNELNENKSISSRAYALIDKELNVSDYLKLKYEDYIKEYAEKLLKTGISNPLDKIVLKIQETAAGYYAGIWESCSINEKILLYDIADDLVLNDKNKAVLNILLKKGLLKYNNYIDIMNRSFRNFIISIYKSEFEEEYLAKHQDAGNWAKYRTPLLLLVLSLAFFIALQENILTDLTSIVTTIIAGLGLLTKVSGVFSKGNTIIPPAPKSN